MRGIMLILNGIGNMITTLPTIEALHERGIDIDVLVSNGAVKEILSKDPRVKNVYMLNPEHWLKLIKLLKNQRYDFAITTYPPQGVITASILYLTNAKIRTQHCNNYMAKFISVKLKTQIAWRKPMHLLNHIFLTHPKHIEKDKHAVYLNLELVNPIVGTYDENKITLKYYLKRDEIEFADNFWERHELNDKFVIGIHTGTGGRPPFKEWPLNYWKELIFRINEKYDVTFLAFIGPSESYHEEYLKKISLKNLIIVKNLPIRQTISLISKCNYFISADSGLAHCASLFKIPQIAMFGPVDYRYIHPFSENCRVLVPDGCKPFYVPHLGFVSKPYNCMKNLKPEKVFKVLEEHLEATAHE